MTTFAPFSAAEHAAEKPAIPAPITTISVARVESIDKGSGAVSHVFAFAPLSLFEAVDCFGAQPARPALATAATDTAPNPKKLLRLKSALLLSIFPSPFPTARQARWTTTISPYRFTAHQTINTKRVFAGEGIDKKQRLTAFRTYATIFARSKGDGMIKEWWGNLLESCDVRLLVGTGFYLSWVLLLAVSPVFSNVPTLIIQGVSWRLLAIAAAAIALAFAFMLPSKTDERPKRCASIAIASGIAATAGPIIHQFFKGQPTEIISAALAGCGLVGLCLLWSKPFVGSADAFLDRFRRPVPWQHDTPSGSSSQALPSAGPRCRSEANRRASRRTARPRRPSSSCGRRTRS